MTHPKAWTVRAMRVGIAPKHCGCGNGANRIIHDRELRHSYFKLAQEYEGLADVLDGKPNRFLR